MNISQIKERIGTRKAVLYVLTFLILIFIWSNSFDHPNESYAKSNKVLEVVSSWLSDLLGPENTLTVFFKSHVRKIAHFTEYLLLGTAVTTGMKLSRKMKIQHFYNSLSFAVIAAVIDEFIQIYTFRGSSVRDVVIDFAGYFTGTVLVLLILSVKILVETRNK